MLFSCIVGSASAKEAIEPYSSNHIASCSATISAVGNGKLKITVSERANGTMSTLGASAIRIYKSDGTYVTRILGTTSNGLLKNNAASLSGSYTYQGSSGTSYYVCSCDLHRQQQQRFGFPHDYNFYENCITLSTQSV